MNENGNDIEVKVARLRKVTRLRELLEGREIPFRSLFPPKELGFGTGITVDIFDAIQHEDVQRYLFLNGNPSHLQQEVASMFEAVLSLLEDEEKHEGDIRHWIQRIERKCEPPPELA